MSEHNDLAGNIRALFPRGKDERYDIDCEVGYQREELSILLLFFSDS